MGTMGNLATKEQGLGTLYKERAPPKYLCRYKINLDSNSYGVLSY